MSPRNSSAQPKAKGGGGGLGLAGITGPASLYAATLSTAMGKGLAEPCSPNRQAYIFGATMGSVPSASNWNCVPTIVDPTTAFDLSSITPNHEVVVALSAFYNVSASHTIKYQWYRARDNKLLFEFSLVIPDPGDYGYDYWDWYYAYSYIGYCSNEIWENGSYYVKILQDSTLLTTINFTVTGITEAPEAPVSSETTVSLAPGESKSVAFEAIPHQARTYQVAVDGQSGSFIAR